MSTINDQLIHSTAIIDKGSKIGIGTKIWHWTHICSGALVGDNCNLGQNVFVSGKAIIGSNVKIQNNVSIYDMVVLEDFVFCGPSVVFTNVKNPRSHISRKNEYKKTIIRKGVSIGANSTILCGIEIGKYAFIGAGSLVTKNVKPFSLMLGAPAIHSGWISKTGERFKFPTNGLQEWKCSETGEIYFYDEKTDMVELKKNF